LFLQYTKTGESSSIAKITFLNMEYQVLVSAVNSVCLEKKK